ncbi:MAG: hypothetical protein J6O49_03110, partial [Bacteroidaceae bacterium]|nr:hypothetical protein [Bacteroidaceae bacterium]
MMKYLRIVRNPYLDNAVWSYTVNDPLLWFTAKHDASRMISKVYRSKDGKVCYDMSDFERTNLSIKYLRQHKKKLLEDFSNGWE